MSLVIRCDYCATVIIPKGLDPEEEAQLIEDNDVSCPICGGETIIDEIEDEDTEGLLEAVL